MKLRFINNPTNHVNSTNKMGDRLRIATYRPQQSSAVASPETKEDLLLLFVPTRQLPSRKMVESIEYPKVDFLNRVAKYPVVSSAIGFAADSYGKAKESSPSLIQRTLSTAEDTVKLATKRALPVVQTLQRPIHVVDSLACKTLDKVEQNLPAINQTPEQIFSSTRSFVNEKWQPVHQQVESAYGVAATVADCILDNPIGRFALMSMEWSVSTCHDYLDFYIPPVPGENPEEPVPEELYGKLMWTARRYFELLSKTHNRVLHRVQQGLLNALLVAVFYFWALIEVFALAVKNDVVKPIILSDRAEEFVKGYLVTIYKAFDCVMDAADTLGLVQLKDDIAMRLEKANKQLQIDQQGSDVNEQQMNEVDSYGPKEGESEDLADSTVQQENHDVEVETERSVAVIEDESDEVHEEPEIVEQPGDAAEVDGVPESLPETESQVEEQPESIQEQRVDEIEAEPSSIPEVQANEVHEENPTMVEPAGDVTEDDVPDGQQENGSKVEDFVGESTDVPEEIPAVVEQLGDVSDIDGVPESQPVAESQLEAEPVPDHTIQFDDAVVPVEPQDPSELNIEVEEEPNTLVEQPEENEENLPEGAEREVVHEPEAPVPNDRQENECKDQNSQDEPLDSEEQPEEQKGQEEQSSEQREDEVPAEREQEPSAAVVPEAKQSSEGDEPTEQQAAVNEAEAMNEPSNETVPQDVPERVEQREDEERPEELNQVDSSELEQRGEQQEQTPSYIAAVEALVTDEVGGQENVEQVEGTEQHMEPNKPSAEVQEPCHVPAVEPIIPHEPSEGIGNEESGGEEQPEVLNDTIIQQEPYEVVQDEDIVPKQEDGEHVPLDEQTEGNEQLMSDVAEPTEQQENQKVEVEVETEPSITADSVEVESGEVQEEPTIVEQSEAAVVDDVPESQPETESVKVESGEVQEEPTIVEQSEAAVVDGVPESQVEEQPESIQQEGVDETERAQELSSIPEVEVKEVDEENPTVVEPGDVTREDVPDGRQENESETEAAGVVGESIEVPEEIPEVVEQLGEVSDIDGVPESHPAVESQVEAESVQQEDGAEEQETPVAVSIVEQQELGDEGAIEDVPEEKREVDVLELKEQNGKVEEITNVPIEANESEKAAVPDDDGGEPEGANRQEDVEHDEPSTQVPNAESEISHESDKQVEGGVESEQETPQVSTYDTVAAIEQLEVNQVEIVLLEQETKRDESEAKCNGHVEGEEHLVKTTGMAIKQEVDIVRGAA